MNNRTDKQNRALHKYLGQLAEALNEAGYDMKKTLKPGIDIPWEKETIKKYLFKPIAQAMTGKNSTADLTTKEISQAYEVLNRHTAEKFGISVPWPHREDV